jgi:hypothetical protein
LAISICFDKLYLGCKKRDIPFSFITWQFVLIGWLGYLTIGFPNSGSVGFATFIDLVAKSKSVWSKFISFLTALSLAVLFFAEILVLQQAQKYQKVSGLREGILADEVAA